MTGGEFRFDRHSGQWVNVVGARQNRPNLPADGCPFCVGGLEAPDDYDVRWFANRWPALEPGAPLDLSVPPDSVDAALPATGAAEVVLYSPRHDASLGSLGEAQVRKVVDLWAARTAELMSREEIDYVLVFESRGAEVGATIHHPHGQIYGYPFVPPVPLAEREASRRHGDLVLDELASEVSDGRRVVFDGGDWVGWVPFASPYPYGLRLAPRTMAGRLDQLDATQRDGLAAALCDVFGRYERLWADEPGRSEIFPYLMWFHQAGRGDDVTRLHLHLAPPQRSPGVLRYLAAGEVGSGTYSNPVIPEDAARTLRSLSASSGDG